MLLLILETFLLASTILVTVQHLVNTCVAKFKKKSIKRCQEDLKESVRQDGTNLQKDKNLVLSEEVVETPEG